MIQIIGDINEESFEKFDKELRSLESSPQKIKVLLMSNGGDASVGLAFWDRIKLSPRDITITAYGQVGSAAVIIFAAGDHRVMAPSASIYLHEETLESEASPLSSITRELKQLQSIDSKYNYLMQTVTNKNEAFWQGLNEAETYLNPDDCLDYGLCDEILKYKAKK